jgi:hypothetical protein
MSRRGLLAGRCRCPSSALLWLVTLLIHLHVYIFRRRIYIFLLLYRGCVSPVFCGVFVLPSYCDHLYYSVRIWVCVSLLLLTR